MNIRILINDDMTLNLLAGTSKIIRPAEAFEDLTWKTVWYSSGYGSGYWLAKKAFKPVGDYFRATTENALKKYTTPAGYVDPLQDELVDQMYENHAHALGDILGIDDLPEDLAQIVIKRGIATEKSALYNWIKTDLRTMPFANVEEKMAYIESEIQTKFHLTTDELHKYLAVISTDDESLKKFADTLMNITDKDVQAKYMKRQEYYKIQKEVLAFLKKTGELEPSKRFDAVNKFLQENFQMDVTQFTKYIEDPDLDGSADWFRDYFTNVKIDSMKHSLLKKEIKDEFNKIIYGEDEYEGGTRLAVLNDFMKGQHNIDLDNYIEVIKAKAQKNPDMYQKYFEDLVQMKKRLEIKDAMAKDISQVRAKATLTKELKKRSTDLFEDVVKMETSLTDMYEGLPKSLPTLLRKVDSGFTIEEITTRATATLTKVNDAFRNLIKDPFLLQDTKLSKAVDQFEQLTDDFNNWLLNLKSAKDVKGMDKLSKQINETINTIKMRLAQLQNLPSDAPKLNKFVTLKQGMKQGQDLFKKMQQKLINANAPENLEEAIAILQKQYPDVPVETLIEDYKKAIDDSIFVRSTDKVLRMNKKDGVELITKKEIDDFQTVLFDFFGMDTSVEEAVLKAYEEDITLPEYIAQTVLDWVSSVFSEPLLINEWVKAITDIFSNERDACYEGLQNFFNLLSFAKLIEPAQVTDKPNTLFNKFEPYLFSSAKLMQDTKAVTADTIRYAMKVNANQVVDLMMTDEHFQEIVESLLTPGTTLGDFLDTAIANGNQEAVIFKDRIQSFINYRDFLDLLYNYVGVNHDGFDAVRPNVINAFTDVLQMSARTDPENIADNIHSVFYYIMQRTEEQLQSYTMPGSYSIEALSKRPEILEALAKHNIDPTEVHHALDDSKMTRIVREQLLGEKFAGKHVYDFDIESTGLDAGLGTVVEIAGVGDNFEFNAVRELFQDEVPKVSAIRKMYDLPADMSNAEVREYWQEYYRLNGSGNERTILKRFIQKLQELNADRMQ
jgi:hypothetical protein